MPAMHSRNASHHAGRLPTARSARMRLDLLHTFEAAARLLSFTRAGDELALSQSAVSRQIQQLEDNLGVPLFARGHRTLTLTEPGLILQRAVDDALQRLLDAAARMQAAPASEVAITCTPGFASFWLIPRLARFTADHPGVDVRISATLQVQDLQRHRLHAAVRFVPSEGARGVLLFEEEVQPMCAPRLLQDPARPLSTPADLWRHTLLTVDLPDAAGVMMDWGPWLSLMKLPAIRPHSTIRFTQYAEAVSAAVAGHGVVIGRLPLLAQLLRDGLLVAPFHSGASSRRGYFLEVSAQAADHPAAMDFVRWLQREAGRTPA